VLGVPLVMTRLKTLLLILYVLTIFFLSSRPYLSTPGPDFPSKDKVVHCGEYFLLGLLLFGGIGATVRRAGPGLVFFFLFAVGVSVGALDEILQSYIPGRVTDLNDWFSDAFGVAMGVSLAMLAGFRSRIIGSREAS
jgi:VanZ family protein